jgi:hypothetical protein
MKRKSKFISWLLYLSQCFAIVGRKVTEAFEEWPEKPVFTEPVTDTPPAENIPHVEVDSKLKKFA